jgi:arylsulfatase A-like enzyme
MRISAHLLLALLTLLVFSAAFFCVTEAAKPNILLILADDLGYADVGSNGYSSDIATPKIDAIAEGGVRFTAGYATHSVCSPSRAGLMSGMYQHRFGFETNSGPERYAAANFGLPSRIPTLAEKLNAAGYATGMIGKWHIGFREGLRPHERGFDYSYAFLSGARSFYPDPGGNSPLMRNGRITKKEPPYLTDAFADEAIAFIERSKDSPWFLYLAFSAVHIPLQATEKYEARFPDIVNPKRRTLAAMLAAMDDAVGRVMEKVRESGDEENTLVLFYSDNGGIPPKNVSLNEPLRGMKGTMFEGGIRVPFIAQWKGTIPAGMVYDNPVMGFDYHATALAAAGATLDNGFAPPLDGVDLLPFLTGHSKGRPHDALYWRSGKQHAVRLGDWKLVRQRGKAPMLFNLARDLSETEDVAASNPEKFTELATSFAKWSGEVMKPQWIRQDRRNALPGGKLKNTPTRGNRNKGLQRDNPRRQDSPTHPDLSWTPGERDVNGVRMNGTEVLKITAHKGALFAGTSMWMESDPDLDGCQVLVKETSGSAWKIDLPFGSEHGRLTSLTSFEFRTNHRGETIKPVRILLASPTTRRGGTISVWSRRDKAGGWSEMPLGKARGAAQIRGMGFHRDRVTGIDMVFAGVSGTKASAASLGMLTGSYKAGVPGRMVWNREPELVLSSGERFMEFAVCNGLLYASSSNHIFQRTDGLDPFWKSVYYDPRQSAPGGLRGLVTVPTTGGRSNEQSLLFISKGKIYRLDPAKGHQVSLELDIAAYVAKQRDLPINGSLAGYNKIVHHAESEGPGLWLIGFQCSYDQKYIESGGAEKHHIKVRNDGKRPIRYFASEGNYLIRAVKNGKPFYELRTIEKTQDSQVGAVRTICRSPFEKEDNVLYMGGVDCNGMPSHDTAWIYRVELTVAR